MRVKKITIDPDPYELFHLAQGYRVGELLDPLDNDGAKIR